MVVSRKAWVFTGLLVLLIVATFFANGYLSDLVGVNVAIIVIARILFVLFVAIAGLIRLMMTGNIDVVDICEGR